MRKILTILTILLLVQFSTDVFAECIEGNCDDGQGTFTSADGDQYIGEWKDGKPHHGQGTYRVADGTTKTGIWEDGKYIGTVAEVEKRNRIYNACILDKSSDVDMQTTSVIVAVEETCKVIAKDPSWLESWKYE